jgi:Anti-sigma-K factor rskA/Putative zinc-finger
MADPELLPESEHEDLAGWVLGALDPAESERFGVHLESCRECQDAVAEFEPAAQLLRTAGSPDQLPADSGPDEPPADLEERTLARVRQASRKRGWRHRTGYRWAAAAAVVVAAAGGTTAVTVAQSVPASAFTIPMQARDGSNASGKAVAHHTSSGWSIAMTVHDLKRLGPGRFYECWYASPDSTPGHLDLITAGTFTVDAHGNASMQMWSAADPKQFPTMQITEESAGDASQQGEVILSGTARA